MSVVGQSGADRLGCVMISSGLSADAASWSSRPTRTACQLARTHMAPHTCTWTYHEIHILRIRHPLKFDRQLLQIPHLDHRLVRARAHGMQPIGRGLDLVGGLRECKVLHQLELTDSVLRLGPLSLPIDGPWSLLDCYPGWQGGGRGGRRSVDRVNFRERHSV